ncbi:MAG: FAD:protein FMN transferase [Bacteroidota bacterium]|nr:FAD:protein FMN transferase [Bacteroidota bacterium]
MKLNMMRCYNNERSTQDRWDVQNVSDTQDAPGTRNRRTTRGVWNLFLLLGITLLMACNPGSKRENWSYFHDQGMVFATNYSIKYAYHRSLQAEIEAAFQAFSLSLNPFMENSIISKVNRNEPMELDSLFLTVFRKSEEVHRNSGGKFDITLSPLINAWGFGFQNMGLVTPEMIDSLKEFVGQEKISIDPQGKIVKSDPRVQLNTSAIAKGYACDVIADLLERDGIEHYLVVIGGEISARGLNDRGICWRIQVDKPVDDTIGFIHEPQVVLGLCDKSLATSGNYRNFYILDGKRYAHTIDPHTGYPSQNELLSVTIIADDCMTADAYATAFMALGLEEAKKLAARLPELEYYLIHESEDGSYGVTCSDGFQRLIVDPG